MSGQNLPALREPVVPEYVMRIGTDAVLVPFRSKSDGAHARADCAWALASNLGGRADSPGQDLNPMARFGGLGKHDDLAMDTGRGSVQCRRDIVARSGISHLSNGLVWIGILYEGSTSHEDPSMAALRAAPMRFSSNLSKPVARFRHRSSTRFGSKFVRVKLSKRDPSGPLVFQHCPLASSPADSRSKKKSSCL